MIPVPTFTIIPDFTDAPVSGVSAAKDVVKLGQAQGVEFYNETEPTRNFGFRMKLTTRAEIEALKLFFRDRGGRCESFRCPSWRDDLTLVSSDGATITVADPSAIADGHADSHSRWLFIWDADELHVTPWTSKTDNGTTWTYRLETPLPFTPAVGTAMVGFAHLVRFADDRLRLNQRAPYVAEGDVAMRAPRHWSAVTLAAELTPAAFNQSPGFASATVEPDDLLPIEHRIAYALGPATLRSAATPATRWACWLGSDGIPRLKATVGTITLPDATGSAAALFGSAIATARLSLAFNHAGAEFIAWQNGVAINLRWFNGSAQSATWDGWDPVLAYNWFTDTGMSSAAAEVVCFYLRPGSVNLYARYGSESFAVERIAATLPAKPAELRGLLNNTDLLIGDASYRLVTLASA